MSVAQAERDFAKLLFLISEIEKLHPDTAFTIGVVTKEVIYYQGTLLPTEPLAGITIVAETFYLPNSLEIPNYEKIRVILPLIKEIVVSLPSFVEDFLDGHLHFIGGSSRNPPELSAHEKMELLQKVKEISDTFA